MPRKITPSYAEVHRTIADSLRTTPLRYASVRSPVPRDFDRSLVGVDPAVDVTGLGKDRSMGALSRQGGAMSCFTGVSRERWAAGGLSRAQVAERLDQAALQYDWDAGDHGNAHSIGAGLVHTPRTYAVVRSPSRRFNDHCTTPFRRRVNELEYDTDVGWSGVRGYSTPVGAFPEEAVRSYIGTREQPHKRVFWPHTRKHPQSSAPADSLRRRRFAEQQIAASAKRAAAASAVDRKLRPNSAPTRSGASQIASEAPPAVLPTAVAEICACIRKRNPVINRRIAKLARQPPPRSAPLRRVGGSSSRRKQQEEAAAAAVVLQYHRATPFVRYHVAAGGLDEMLDEWERGAMRARRKVAANSSVAASIPRRSTSAPDEESAAAVCPQQSNLPASDRASLALN